MVSTHFLGLWKEVLPPCTPHAQPITIELRYLRFSLRCSWKIQCSWMWRRVDWYTVTDVSINDTAFIFRVKQHSSRTLTLTTDTTILRNVRRTWNFVIGLFSLRNHAMPKRAKFGLAAAACLIVKSRTGNSGNSSGIEMHYAVHRQLAVPVEETTQCVQWSSLDIGTEKVNWSLCFIKTRISLYYT
jgi:hypothetical protein